MGEITYETYELRGGSNSLGHTHLIEKVEAASIEDVLWRVEQTLPTDMVWIVNKTGNTKPFMRIPVKLGPPITPMAAQSKL